MNNVLVTGASGYLGRRYIAENSAASLFCMTHNAPVPSIAATRQITAHASIEEMTGFFLENRIDTILHLATLFRVDHIQNDIGAMLDANVALGTKLLQAAVNASVAKFIFTSTSWEMHSSGDPTPVNFYAACKAAFASIAAFFGASKQLAVLQLDLFDTFGPNDTRGKLVQALLEAQPGKHFALSPGKQKHSFVYINDILDALQNAIDMTACPGLYQYSLHGDEILSLEEVVATITHVTGKKLKIEWGEKQYRPREVMNPNIRYPRLLGWSPDHTLKSGLEKMYGKIEH